MKPVIIIAEAGVNHNGSITMAKKLVDAAEEAGADFVKFQTFKAEKLASSVAQKATYQKTDDDSLSQLQMLKALELSDEMHHQLRDYCASKKVSFLSTAFEQESLEYLDKRLNLTLHKIPSGEITNGPLLVEFGRTKKPLVLSTGMASLEEVELALMAIGWGMTQPQPPNNIDDIRENWSLPSVKDQVKRQVTLLHCTSQYPAPMEDVNLKAMTTLGQVYGTRVGYSDHTQGIEVAIAATALGAKVIEKHFTLDRTLEGPDHKASLEPDELTAMVSSIRHIESALGDGIKQPRESETNTIAVARKSLVAATPISAGEVFCVENVTVKRPSTGRSPMEYWSTLGSIAQRDYQPDEVIQ
ncbi:MAG: N-acetylneuraminate synthase [Cellvibrionaceae bacterium]